MAALPSSASDLGSGLKAENIQHILRERIAILSGGRDRDERPLILFPRRVEAERTSGEDIRLVLNYVHSIPSDEDRNKSFLVLIDMRGGVTWAAVKPVLRTLHEHFPGNIHAVLIIKPDKFWEKHKANLATGKWSFEVHMVGVESLSRWVDRNQLTEEFGGTMAYDHEEWIELRMVLESVIWRALDDLRALDQIREEVENGAMPVDVDSARVALDHLASLKRRIGKARVEELETEGQRLIDNLSATPADDSDYGSGPASTVAAAAANPDFAPAADHVSNLLHNLRDTQARLHSLAHTRKIRLDQCFKLKLFEQDADRMFEWIRQHVELFLHNYSDIGTDEESAKKAQADHDEFTRATMNTIVNMEHIEKAAARLLDAGHYASSRIEAVASRLKADWDVFTRALDTRGAVLSLSLNFHYKAEEFRRKASDWEREVRRSGEKELEKASSLSSPDATPAVPPALLEAAIRRHQQLCDDFTHHYSEVHGLSKDVLLELTRLVQLALGADEMRPADAEDPSMPAVCEGRALVETLQSGDELGGLGGLGASYRAGADHVLGLMHTLNARQRELELLWDARSVRLHTRLTLLLFHQDVLQIFDWLDNHGTKFLKKNTGIGKSLTRARQLKESQEEFEKIAKMTFTNADSLLSAAKELAGRGEVRREEVFSISEVLGRRMKEFEQKVSDRRVILHLSVLVHTHQKEILAWYAKETEKAAALLTLDASIDKCEDRQDTYLKNEEETKFAFTTVRQEGQQLISHLRQQASLEAMDNTEPIALVEAMLGEVTRGQAALDASRPQQRTALQLGANFRLFEQDCRIILEQLGGWKEDMQQMLTNLTPDRAGSIIPLHQDNTAQVKNAEEEIMQMAEQHLTLLDQSGLDKKLKTQDGTLVIDQIFALVKSVRTQVQEVMVMAESNEVALESNLEQEQTIRRFQEQVNELNLVIYNTEQLLDRIRVMPSSHDEASRMKKDHEVLNSQLGQYNSQFRTLEQRAEEIGRAEQGASSERVRGLMADLVNRWKTVVGQAEQLGRFFATSEAFYKSIDIFPLMEHLMAQFSGSEDACAKFKAGMAYWANEEGQVIHFLGGGGADKPGAAAGPPIPVQSKRHYAELLLAHHSDYKSKVQQSCSYASNSCTSLIHLIRRMFGASTSEEFRVMQQLELLRKKEPEFLKLWSTRNGLLQACEAFCRLEGAAKTSLDFLHEEAEAWIAAHALQSKTDKAAAELILTDLAAFKADRLSAEREAVRKLLLEAKAADVGRFHGAQVRDWLDSVQSRYSDFTQRLDKLESRANLALGRTPDVDAACKRLSDASLDPASATAGPKRSSASRKKDLVMAEIIKTEEDYVKDLEECMNLYLTPLEAADAPTALKAHKETIFSNITQIHRFHQSQFLKELRSYINLPEDVGHLFIGWQHHFQLYVTYCRNKELSNQVVTSPQAVTFFHSVKEKSGLDSSKDLEWYLIKPVQRITKYQLLLHQLLSACDDEREGAEIAEAAEVIASVPRRANDLLHLSALAGFKDKDSLGEILLQEGLTVWEPRPKGQLLNRKGRERQVFLFDLCLVFAKKEAHAAAEPDPSAAPGILQPAHKKLRYTFKTRLMVSEINVTEHMEGDECKFAVWTGLVPTNETRTIFKAGDYKSKVEWVRKLRDLVSQRILTLNLPASHDAGDSGWVEGSSEGRTRDSDAVSTSSQGASERRSVHSLNAAASLDHEIGKMILTEPAS